MKALKGPWRGSKGQLQDSLSNANPDDLTFLLASLVDGFDSCKCGGTFLIPGDQPDGRSALVDRLGPLDCSYKRNVWRRFDLTYVLLAPLSPQPIKLDKAVYWELTASRSATAAAPEAAFDVVCRSLCRPQTVDPYDMVQWLVSQKRLIVNRLLKIDFDLTRWMDEILYKSLAPVV